MLNKHVKSLVFVTQTPHDLLGIEHCLPSGYSLVPVESVNDAAVLLSCGLQGTLITNECVKGSTLLALKEASLFKPVMVVASGSQISCCISALRDGADGYFELPKENDLLKYALARKLNYHDTLMELEELSYRLLIGRQNGNHSFDEFRILKQTADLPITVQELSQFFQTETQSGAHATFLETLCSILNQDGISTFDASFKVLLVEDEPGIRHILYKTLEDNGFLCDQAGSGEEALSILSSKAFDVVVLDIGLPGKQGNDLVEDIKGVFQDTEIIMLTAFADIKLIKSCFTAGASDYLLKPYNRAELCLKVLSACQNKQLRLMMKNTKQTLLETLSRRQKEDILTQLYYVRREQKKELRLQDLYLVFPELKKNNEDIPIPEQIMNDGIGLFIEVLERSLKEGISSREVIEKWE